jgi:hypothetical protein
MNASGLGTGSLAGRRVSHPSSPPLPIFFFPLPAALFFLPDIICRPFTMPRPVLANGMVHVDDGAAGLLQPEAVTAPDCAKPRRGTAGRWCCIPWDESAASRHATTATTTAKCRREKYISADLLIRETGKAAFLLSPRCHEVCAEGREKEGATSCAGLITPRRPHKDKPESEKLREVVAKWPTKCRSRPKTGSPS